MKKHGKKETFGKEKPNLFSFHDYRSYLKERIEFEKSATPGFSLRKMAQALGFAPGYLPMVLAGDRSLSSEVLAKVGELLSLGKEEQRYLQALRTIAESHSQTLRLEALEELQRSRSYREKNPREMEVHQYLTHWFNVAIREMVNLEGFSLDAKWIRSRLRTKIPVTEIQKALDFLLKNGFLQKLPGNKAKVLTKKLECTGSVYRLVLSEFHRTMLKLASESLDSVPFEERSITGLTFPIPVSRYQEIFQILDQTLDKIDSISAESKGSDTVYHVGISFFPLTHNKQRGVR